MSASQSQFAVIGVPCDYHAALEEVGRVIHRMFPMHSLASIELAFARIEAAFEGRLPGYQHLQAPYHNRCHTLEVSVCTARLLHGLHVSGTAISSHVVDASVIAALFHDSGYLKTVSETGGSGAQFTIEHVTRSVHFARQSLSGLDADLQQSIFEAIQATDHRMPRSSWVCSSPESELAACVTATADMVGQMASREYLERLLFLFFEFREAGVGGFRDLHELLEKTMSFYQDTRKRLFDQLEGTVNALERHFEVVLGQKRNHYLELVDRNIDYLQSILQEDRDVRLAMLKRGGIVEQARQMM